jgi:hypothetical protein
MTRRAAGRTWKKSAIIIGGSTAAGAGVGAVMGGGSGAKKGAVVGLLGGVVYDIADARSLERRQPAYLCR